MNRGGRGLPDLGPRGEGWVLGQVVILVLLVAVSLPRLRDLVPASGIGWAAVVIGAATMAAGGVTVIAAVRQLGTNVTPFPRPGDTAVLIERGIYAVIRHPIYAGIVLGSFGWSLVARSWPAAALSALLAIYFDLKSRREDAWLDERYTAHAAYRERTRRFIPGLY
jgi:protein-S-isoprenylcysteine O-methyltransferase Ste14